jgi:hypothetical protein
MTRETRTERDLAEALAALERYVQHTDAVLRAVQAGRRETRRHHPAPPWTYTAPGPGQPSRRRASGR